MATKAPTFQSSLLDWFKENQRSLPWRSTKDPYAIWVSEVMLQQTQVAVVIPYYQRWLLQFPTVEALAAATEDEVLHLWQGLGYYRRAKNLLSGARHILQNGQPKSAAEWRKVPGVGRYTAGAISSIALRQHEPVVDCNVERVFARVCAESASGATRSSLAWKWAENVLPEGSPGEWNQALMELGATICLSGVPKCPVCPIRTYCKASLTGQTSEFPKHLAKKAPIEVKEVIWILTSGDRIAFEKRKEGTWWAGLFALPTDIELSPSETSQEIGTVCYAVTNHRVSAQVRRMSMAYRQSDYAWLTDGEIQSLAIPAPHKKALTLHHKI